MKKTVFRSVLALLILSPSLALAQGTCDGSDGIGNIAKAARDSATALLQGCANAKGLQTSGQAVVTIAAGTAAAILPLEGVESLTRDSLNTWRTVGIFTASPPAEAGAPGGTFFVRVQAPPGSSTGSFQIVSESGQIVQEGDLTIEMATAASTDASSANSPAMDPGSSSSLFYPVYPACYYPYGPYFGIYPNYYYGCYWWTYGWGWGFIRFHYCWWPPFYPYCWWYHGCWW
jgi:hypothetical protein